MIRVKNLNVIALLLVIVGGINWLLVGLFQWDLVGGIFGGMDSVVARAIYIIVGLAAVYSISLFKNVME